MNYSAQPRTAIRFGSQIPVNTKDKRFYLAVPNNRIIPFQIERTSRPETITAFELINDSGYTIDLLDPAYMDAVDYPYLLTFTGIDRIIYKAETLNQDLPGGVYYMHVSDGVNHWYSMDYINVPCYGVTEPYNNLSSSEFDSPNDSILE